MLEVVLSTRFKKDLKTASKRGYNLELLNDVVDKLASRQQLPEKNRDHELSGDYAGFRECDVAPDWLLLDSVGMAELTLHLIGTRSHSDLY